MDVTEGHEVRLREGKEEQEVKHELTYTEGKAHGQVEERTNWVLNHGKGLCASPEVSMPQIQTSLNVSTQAMPRTNKMSSQTKPPPKHQCTTMQTDLPDLKNVNPRLFTDSSIQTTPTTNKIATQALVNPPSPPLGTAMSQLMMATKPASMTTTSSSITTMTSSPALKLPQAPPKQCHPWPS